MDEASKSFYYCGQDNLSTLNLRFGNFNKVKRILSVEFNKQIEDETCDQSSEIGMK